MIGAKRVRQVVLVVEDEALVRLDVADILLGAGYAVLQAANADEAIRILNRRADVRLVYTDVDMPGSMDGIRLAHHISQKWPPVRLLVTSGHIKVSEVDLPEGARFCSKPCPPSEITGAIAGLLAEAGSEQTRH
jgi:CheY-like chemotaxis protein